VIRDLAAVSLVAVALAAAGPVFFFDEALQPGGSSWMWSLQFDADISF